MGKVDVAHRTLAVPGVLRRGSGCATYEATSEAHLLEPEQGLWKIRDWSPTASLIGIRGVVASDQWGHREGTSPTRGT